MEIKNNKGEVVSEAVAIRSYFGMKPDQGLPQFMKELKDLTPEDKTELAVGAAKELGWSVAS